MDAAAIAALAGKAAAGQPMFASNSGPIKGRVLLVDGDALCYTCAGKDDTSAAQARINVIDRIRRGMAAAQAERCIVLVTARSSHKGHRYAVARVKDYQGQRSSGRRPKNWEFLRGFVEGGVPGYTTEVTDVAEADDLFSKYSHQYGAANVVHHTQDKDMRMVPGWHLTWDDFKLTFVPPDTYEHVFDDKVYGTKWFWLQMLHGDAADNIPGLPKYVDPAGKDKLCGPATAEKLLAPCTDNTDACITVASLYRGWYGDDWEVQFLEQAILLWMRRHPGHVFDVLDSGVISVGLRKERAIDPILQRIAEVQACQPG